MSGSIWAFQQANAGYVTAEKLGKIADELRCAYSSFGGIMMWDTSQAYGNFESAGAQFSAAAARNLKRPRNVVCGDDKVPAGKPRTQNPPAQLPPIATLTDLTTSTTAILTTTAVTATSAASASPSIAPIGPPRAPDTSVPRPEPQQHGTLCPIEGGKCQPSASTDLVCDGYNFAICNFDRGGDDHIRTTDMTNQSSRDQQDSSTPLSPLDLWAI
ncbi:hypothetical protein BGX31_001806 [Mortierella sp. GBA43]|nr:hypothetical protein BGX31_001806 [Mortierella sp. GBA43]